MERPAILNRSMPSSARTIRAGGSAQLARLVTARDRARRVGLHPIDLKAGSFPERAPSPPRSLAIQPYVEYLRQRWEQGEHNGRLLFDEIRAQGYPAGLDVRLCSHSALAHAWTNSRPGCRSSRATVSVVFPPSKPCGYSSKRANGTRTARMSQSVLEQSELIARAYDYLRRFRQILRRARRDRFAAMGVRSRGESDSRTCAFREDGCVWIGKPSKMLCCLPPIKGKSRAR
jgi:hypothetical protein